ncbi:nucleotide-diphospho-sugar transferase [Sodiomyces alkalinus F11]|uniref:glycogenin glucosyltransferase n=1 Tax=Sodiomyces alkalinus (strain CBS 110278 / VKM F-3762 / F11) TaxID=1314773 RepID=A0A3N2Q087_SODAK|nr:nucleotide-diphospho-sugar transferase [Sodiomyces alkalinus F11]ROT40108.1 nucleotide-diphospho-sugar transferase [Sodiomyces alkalinus F11]
MSKLRTFFVPQFGALDLLLNDAYLPGALVLAHSLRDASTAKQLAVLVTPDSITAETVSQLKTVYHHVIPVPRIRNDHLTNLRLINRPELHSAFTKIHLWKLTQFSRIVYLDADVLAYRAPDELFDIPAPFSAAPDVGWPDVFNTGVMVLSPSLDDYHVLMAMAERGLSFDGADQGLLNIHFKNSYNRISFTYNVTPVAHYQYIPAFRHFQSSINLVHFIGAMKPWFQGRPANQGDSPFNEMVVRWWAVYDRHYGGPQTVLHSTGPPKLQEPDGPVSVIPQAARHFTMVNRVPPTSKHEQDHYRHGPQGSNGHNTGDVSRQSAWVAGEKHLETSADAFHHLPQPPRSELHGQEVVHRFDPEIQASTRPSESLPAPDVGAPTGVGEKASPVERTVHGAGHLPVETWDAQRQPPPQDAKPEAINFPSQVYEMSRDLRPFIPPERYPSPPRNMWYEVPKERSVSSEAPAMFPWEGRQPRPSRVYCAGESSRPSVPATPSLPASAQRQERQERQEMSPPSHSYADDHSAKPTRAEHKAELVSVKQPVEPAVVRHSIPWDSFLRTNTWDEMPAITRYVQGLQKHRSANNPGLADVSPTERAARQQDVPFANAAVDPQKFPGSAVVNSRSRLYDRRVFGADKESNLQSLAVTEAGQPRSGWTVFAT